MDMDAETQAIWDRWADGRINRAIAKERKAAEAAVAGAVAVKLAALRKETGDAIVETVGTIIRESEAELSRKFEARFKALEAELATAKRLDRLEARMAEADAESLPPMPRQFRAVA